MGNPRLSPASVGVLLHISERKAAGLQCGALWFSKVGLNRLLKTGLVRYEPNSELCAPWEDEAYSGHEVVLTKAGENWIRVIDDSARGFSDEPVPVSFHVWTGEHSPT